MAAFLPILFRILLAIGPTLIALATHNYSVPSDGTGGLLESLLRPLLTHGALLAGVGSLGGALAVHSKIIKGTTAEIPKSITSPTATDRDQIFDLLWQSLGKDATDVQFKAFSAMRAAASDKGNSP